MIQCLNGCKWIGFSVQPTKFILKNVWKEKPNFNVVGNYVAANKFEHFEWPFLFSISKMFITLNSLLHLKAFQLLKKYLKSVHIYTMCSFQTVWRFSTHSTQRNIFYIYGYIIVSLPIRDDDALFRVCAKTERQLWSTRVCCVCLHLFQPCGIDTWMFPSNRYWEHFKSHENVENCPSIVK